MDKKERIRRRQEIRERMEKEKLTTREERRRKYESVRLETEHDWKYYSYKLDHARYQSLIELDAYDTSKFFPEFFRAGIYVNVITGRPYLVTEIERLYPSGSTLAENWKSKYGTPRAISYEEMIALAEEVYPGIEEKYQGINHTNWQEYKDAINCYMDDLYQSLYQSNLDNSIDSDAIVSVGFDKLSEQDRQEEILPRY